MFSLSRLAAAFTSALCLVGTVLIPSGASALLVNEGELGGFDLDGNLGLSDSVLDWANATGVVTIGDDTADSGFHTGSKEAEPSKWDCAPLSHPGKDDIVRAYVSQHTDAGGLYLDVAWVRREVSGDGSAHLNFEFNKAAQATPPADGDCPLVRTAGDLLLSYDFGGGTTSQPDIRAFTWDPTLKPGNDEGTWVERTLTASMVKGAVNIVSVTDPLVGATPETLTDRRFGEATIDFGALLAAISPTTCVSYVTAHVRSRSSGSSIDSALQDKLAPTPVNIGNCGRVAIEKRSDSQALLPGATFQVLGANQTTVIGSCTTGSLGVCSVTNLVPGTYYVRESQAPAGYTGVSGFIGGALTVAPGGTASVSATNIRWQYRLTLTPAEDTNLVDNDHVFVATLTKSTDGGDNFAPAGTERIDFGLAGIGAILGIAPSGPVGGSCTTNAAGTCTVTIRSAAPGDSTLSAAYDDQVVGTGVEATASAVKHWVNYRIEVAPSGHTNLVGADHTFTVTLERATNGANWAGVAGINPVITHVSGPGDVSGGTCASTGTDAAGECTVILSSDDPGTDVIRASHHAVVSDTSRTFTSTDAVKNWVEYALVVNPDGVHLVGEPHTFTAVLTRDTGSGFAPYAGQTVNLGWNGTSGSSLAGSSCVTAANGTCSIVGNSAVPANGEVTATWGATLDSGPVNLSDKAIARWNDIPVPVVIDDPDAQPDPEILGSNIERPVPAAPVQPVTPAAPVQPATPVIPIVAAPIPEQPIVSAAPLAQPTLPVTGAATAGAIRLAFGFLAAGLTLIAAGRRRQETQA